MYYTTLKTIQMSTESAFIFPLFGDYSWMKDPSSRMLCTDAHRVITELALWDWMKQAEPPSGQGFTFWNPAPLELERLNACIDDSHTGFTYGWTMRQMERVAKLGWENYVTEMKGV